jgi:hypothetical protein
VLNVIYIERHWARAYNLAYDDSAAFLGNSNSYFIARNVYVQVHQVPIVEIQR